jgi:hypothetical protein
MTSLQTTPVIKQEPSAVQRLNAPYGSKTNLRGNEGSSSLPIVVADNTPEHVSIADRTFR